MNLLTLGGITSLNLSNFLQVLILIVVVIVALRTQKALSKQIAENKELSASSLKANTLLKIKESTIDDMSASHKKRVSDLNEEIDSQAVIIKNLNASYDFSQKSLEFCKDREQKLEDNLKISEQIWQDMSRAKIVAIAEDNSIYGTFEIKKENGVIITRKKKSGTRMVNEKVPGRIGFDIDGIVHIFTKKGSLHIFDPLNALTKANIADVVHSVIDTKS